MKARMLSIVWGERHLDWFARACVRSLAQDRNRTSLKENIAAWDIVTREGNETPARLTAETLGLPLEIHIADVSGPSGEILQREIINEMTRCLATESALVIAPPDTIFGEGTIPSLFAVGQPQGICVAVPHVRVKPSAIDAAELGVSNARLVSIAWQHLHRTWIEAECGRPLTNTFAGGVSWRKLGQGLYAVQHLLPTIYLAQFNATDLQWWGAQKLVGAWDHRWPSKLVAEGRQRVICSSDAAFLVEITPEFGNIPPCSPFDPNEPDRFWGGSIGDRGAPAHTIFNRNQIAIFRSGGA